MGGKGWIARADSAIRMDVDITNLPLTGLDALEDGRLVGVVTLGDIREAEPSAATSLSVWELNYLLDTLTIDKIMRRNVLTVSPHTSIRDAAAMMLAHKVSGLPVLEHDRLVGVITESDIFRMLVREMLPEPTKP